jgi:3-phosphoshikimate 1-carboxyvinyltransferase
LYPDMNVTVFPSSITGVIPANPSKSHAQRAIAIAALTQGTSVLKGIGSSDDVTTALQVAGAMGAKIQYRSNAVEIDGGHLWTKDEWHCGESGLSMRMFAAIAALGDKEILLTASGSLLHRSVAFVEEALRSAGVNARGENGRPPLSVTGPFRGGQVSTDASASSQFLSGLLIALPMMSGPASIRVSKLVSTPYIDLTIETMKTFGVHVVHDSYSEFHIADGAYTPAHLDIQGDWSGMAFILTCGALSGDVSITGLVFPTSQADGEIIGILSKCGVQIDIEGKTISVHRTEYLKPIEFDATNSPDLIPVLAALAVHAQGTSRIKGVHRLRDKESDRAGALEMEFRTLGVTIEVQDDLLIIEGGPVGGGIVDAHGDHRIAMALACAALRGTGPVQINSADAIRKSYPDFFGHLRKLGVELSID